MKGILKIFMKMPKYYQPFISPLPIHNKPIYCINNLYPINNIIIHFPV
nr:MAG TPA: hypothetical protein [Caudoviricetes sp.]